MPVATPVTTRAPASPPRLPTAPWAVTPAAVAIEPVRTIQTRLGIRSAR